MFTAYNYCSTVKYSKTIKRFNGFIQIEQKIYLNNIESSNTKYYI